MPQRGRFRPRYRRHRRQYFWHVLMDGWMDGWMDRGPKKDRHKWCLAWDLRRRGSRHGCVTSSLNSRPTIWWAVLGYLSTPGSGPPVLTRTCPTIPQQNHHDNISTWRMQWRIESRDTRLKAKHAIVRQPHVELLVIDWDAVFDVQSVEYRR